MLVILCDSYFREGKRQIEKVGKMKFLSAFYIIKALAKDFFVVVPLQTKLTNTKQAKLLGRNRDKTLVTFKTQNTGIAWQQTLLTARKYVLVSLVFNRKLDKKEFSKKQNKTIPCQGPLTVLAFSRSWKHISAFLAR